MDVSTLPCRPLTVDDLEHLPSDGHRYELVDGVLLVSPPPAYAHQIMLANLVETLSHAAPDDLRVVFAPVGVEVGAHTHVEPDLLVVPRADRGPRKLSSVPLLVAEVLSPSSRRTDPGLKRSVYQDLRVPSYWIADPDEPSLTVLELIDGTYVEAGSAAGDETVTVTLPYPVTITPAALLD